MDINEAKELSASQKKTWSSLKQRKAVSRRDSIDLQETLT